MIIALLMSVMVYSFMSQPKQEVALSERAVPNEALTTLDGNKAQLHDYIGKPTMLLFWATWCIPCNEELPEVQTFYEEHGKDVNIVAINATDTEKSVEAVQQHVRSHGWTFPILIDEQKNMRQLFGALTVPTTIFLRANGEIAHEVYGPIDGAYMEEVLASL